MKRRRERDLKGFYLTQQGKSVYIIKGLQLWSVKGKDIDDIIDIIIKNENTITVEFK